jgi:nitroreductase
METYETIRTIRAVRQYDPRPVPQEVIQRILNAGRLTGSSKNTQPWEFILVQSHDVLVALSKCGNYASHLPHGNFAIVVVTDKLAKASFDAGRCCQNMMLEAWHEGVGSCVATMHRALEAEQVLDIPDDYELQIVIAFGYPVPEAVQPAPRKGGRKPLDGMVHYNRWGNRTAD